LKQSLKLIKRGFLFVLFFLLVTVFDPSLASATYWAKAYGGGSDDQAKTALETSDGGYIVFGNTFSFGAGDHDVWVLKFNNNGDVSWQTIYGESGTQLAYSIQETLDATGNPTGYIVSGHASEDFLVLKLCPDGTDCNGNPADDNNGEIEWQKTYGGSGNDIFTSIKQIPNGDYIITGSTFSFGAGGSDFWVMQLDGNGDVTWQAT